MIRLCAIICLIWSCAAQAQTAVQSQAASEAAAAARALEEASGMLDRADGARDRVKALTQTIQAFEAGLGAMREGLRQVTISETRLSRKLAVREEDVARLLAVLLSMGDGPSPVTLLHPDGPTGTARAGMLLSELTPALNKQADQLRVDLEDLQTLQALQVDASERVGQALTEVQAARTALNQAMANRTDLPTRFTEDPVRTAILIASTETLDGFASGLSEIVTDQTGHAPLNLSGQIGNLDLPVQGLILRRANEADAAGVARPGWVMAARPRAIVTTPTAATIRYAGPLLDFGTVVILEPQVDTLFVFAGLETVYGETGQVLAQGTPIGLLGGKASQDLTAASPLREGTGTDRSETLYIEVRQNNIPQDPKDWFRTDEDGEE